jgi:soluble lytic murein transglycosylase-like protein
VPQRALETVTEPNIKQIIRDAANKYGLDGNRLVAMASCESTLNPNAVNYNYYENGHPSGLLQHISGYWPARAEKYGYKDASVFDATANANVTAGMIADGLSYLWSCKY